LKLEEARRVAIAATGLGVARPSAARITTVHLRKVVSQVGIVQLDSVNAVARAHELLFFSRLGPYDQQLLHDLAYRKRELYEGWVHEACLVPTSWWPRLRWRRFRDGASFHLPTGPEVDEVRRIVAERGPTAPGDIEHLREGSGAWWGWSKGKRAMEVLLVAGELGVATRRRAFERVYDLVERVMPAEVLQAPPVPEPEARRFLVIEAARSLGVGTMADIADYHRQKRTPVKAVIKELVAAGALEQIEVEGWTDPAYVVPGTRVPRRGCPDGRLVSPFDPLVWYRPRNVRLFDFQYAIEIYVPEPKRVYGYYVLPFLQGDSIVARVDVRSDRRAGVLRVPGAFAEAGADVDVELLMGELRLLASWQGCGDVAVGAKGSLSKALRRVRP